MTLELAADVGKSLPKSIELKVLELLKIRKNMTFFEITNELNLQNGDKELLLQILFKLEAEGKIQRENIQIITDKGLSLTSKYSL